MGLGQRFTAAYNAFKGSKGGGYERAMAAEARDAATYNSVFSNDMGKTENQLKLFEQSPALYTTVMRLARDAAASQWLVYRKGKAGKRDELQDHEVLTLLANPNPWMSQEELFVNYIAYYLITGNAYMLYQGTPGGAPTELYPVRSDRMKVVAGKSVDDFVKGYVYSVNGQDVPLAREEVCHWRTYHPRSDYYGLSPVEVLALAVQSDVAMEKWNYNVFGKDNAIPSSIVSLPATTSDRQFEQIKRDYTNAYGGTQRKTAFIRGGDIDIKINAFSQRDMEFLEGRDFTRDEILNLYGIPAGLYFKNATEANAQAATETYTSRALYPLVASLGKRLTQDLMPFYGEDLIIEPEDIRVKDAAAERLQIQAEAPYFTINEQRERHWQLAPVDWGDIPAQGAGAVAITGQPVGGSNPKLMPGEVRQEPGDAQTATEERAAETAAKFLSTDAQRRWFFANNPQFAAQGNMPQLREGGTREEHRQDLEKFAEHSKTRLSNHLWDTGMIGYNDNAQVDVNSQKVKEEATSLVRDIRDAQYPKSYVLSTYREVNGSLSDAHAEKQISQEYADKAQAVLLAAHVGKVNLTESQTRYLQSVAKGGYLKEKYAQYASGERGTLAGPKHEQLRANSEYAQHMRQVHREEFQQVRNHRYMGPGKSADDDTIDIYPTIPRIYFTRAMRTELDQFQRYATKGKDIDAFVFHEAPLPIEMAVKALADCGQLDLLPVKANDKLISKAERQLASAFGDYLDGLKARLIVGIRHVNSPASGKALPDKKRFLSYFNSQFWRGELDELVSVVQPVIQDTVSQAAQDEADQLQMATGIGFDPHVFEPRAAQYAQDYIDAVLKGFNTTSAEGTGAIISRYVATGDATLDDLIAAVQESGLFSGNRARLVAVTENTRAVGAGTYLAGEELAGIAGVDVALSMDDYSGLHPAHPGDRCGISAEFIYDDNDNIIGMDYRWRTSADERVCDICQPRDGKLLSEIAAEGL